LLSQKQIPSRPSVLSWVTGFLFCLVGFLFGLVAFPWMTAGGQVVINEFSASNAFTIADPDYDDYADWLELYNAGEQAVNLNGYCVTDDVDSPLKWQIRTDTVILPGGYLIIWADDKNTGLHASYKISADGEELALFSPSLELLDSVSFTTQVADVSFGRAPDGGADWAYFTEPTPGRANSTKRYADIVFHVPEFSVSGGLYSGPVTVQLGSGFGGVIRYTTDGSEPSDISQQYTSPLTFNGTTILRARIFKPGMVPGPVITHSYFIGENSAGAKLPVVSLATHPDNFWDPVTGIYTQDFKPEWEVPVNIELFENNGMDRASFNQRAGVKINGLYSWQLPQKMLGVYFRNSYGPGNLDYRVIPQRERNSYKTFALRASGSDWSYTLFRDVLAQHATLYNMDIDIMGFKPAIVFVNGEYLGIHNIREKVDADYIESSYGMLPGSFDLVENQDYPEAGDLLEYGVLRELLDKDLSVTANYQAVLELMDIENYTDMVITEMACRNTSINHNVMAWKPKEGGKWRWVLMDLDRGFFDAGDRFISWYLGQRQLLLNEMWRNQSYREFFARRLCSHLFTTFNPERMEDLVSEHESAIESEIPRHIQRWDGATSSYGDAIPSEVYWRNEVGNLRNFVRERPPSLLADLQNYGFPGIASLVLAAWPEEGGTIRLNGMKTAGAFSYGPCLLETEIQISARERPGYDFGGWYEVPREWIIPPGSVWKYNDGGTDPGASWVLPGYDDSSWSQGEAELGYGDNDEATVVGYGPHSSDRYITTWFRKPFEVTREQLQEGRFFIHLLKDDGAVVYLNGTEIARANIPCGEIAAGTLAETGISGTTEEVFITWRIDPALLNEGSNLIAAEVHQNAASSSDLSFDLRFSCYRPDRATFYSADRTARAAMTNDRYLMAAFAPNGACVVPEVIAGEMTLSADCSPYLVQGDVLIMEHATLRIDPGVEIRMPGGGNMFVHGVLEALGTNEAPVVFRLNPHEAGGRWGGLVFRNTTGTSTLRHVTVEDAWEGPDPVLEKAAISCFNADLVMDHLEIVQVHSNPVIARYSDITLTNSTLHSEVTGDLINVKYGNGFIENCRFTGNGTPDNDAIDYDETGTGIIRNCIITGFHGFNSDGVDIGEGARNVEIDSIVVYDVTDKGISLGQSSSATVSNSLFVNCTMGVAVKDSGNVVIRNCTFYGTGIPVACYEKNVGLAGGNARVVSSILSNASDGSYLADSKSGIRISYSLSDNTPLPEGDHNLFGNPLFAAPSYFDFGLDPSSPAILSGISPGGPVDMGSPEHLGALLSGEGFGPPVMIAQLFINGSNLDRAQYIMLYNPSTEAMDLSGWTIDKGVTAEIPDGTLIQPGGRVFITNNSFHPMWESTGSPVIHWTTGRLSGNGESVRLVDRHGLVADYLVYSEDDWPSAGFQGDEAFVLTDAALDNHFGENWTTGNLFGLIVSERSRETDRAGEAERLSIWPNPTRGIIHILRGTITPAWDEQDSGFPGGWIASPGNRPAAGGGETDARYCDIMTSEGILLQRLRINPAGPAEADLSGYGPGLYLVRIGSSVGKVVVMK